MTQPQIDQKFETLLEYLRRSRGFDFTGYKRPSLMRRVLKRMQTVNIAGFDDYQDYLEVHPEEFAQLFNTILINVTAFFRDEPAWRYLASEIFPRLLASKKPDAPIRAWSAGCASGEETYTLAILLAEALGSDAFRQRVKIYATDVDEEALNHARQASYSAKDLQSLPDELRGRYFEWTGSHFVFRSDLRRSVIFGRHDLVQDAPISRLDLLVSRNTLMYFNAETQSRIVANFHFALSDPGYLMLGKAEMLLTHANLFTPIDLKYRIFSKVPQVDLRERVLAMTQAGNAEAANHFIRQTRLREMALDVGPLAQIVVDINGNLAQVNERARLYLGLSLRDVGRPFQDLEISYRPVELRSLIEQAYIELRPIMAANVIQPMPNGEERHLDIQVAPLRSNGGEPLGVSITFDDVTRNHRLREELQRTNQELITANEELQSTNEELETTNEELQSTVEELETTNEELQSTNEELETMNEELQSTNEELETINAGLHRRTQELNQANAFMQSVFKGMRDGVAVLDRRLSLLAWNRRAEDMWGLRFDEVQGQSFFNLDIGLPVEKLKDPIRACLNAESEAPEVILDATNRRGRVIRCRIICTALVGIETIPQGVIVLMEGVRE